MLDRVALGFIGGASDWLRLLPDRASLGAGGFAASPKAVAVFPDVGADARSDAPIERYMDAGCRSWGKP
jgi:hypothetical protein